MNLRTTLFAIIAFTFSTAVLAAVPTTPTKAPDCKTSPADQKYWSKVYTDAVAHGTAAAKAKDVDEAGNALQVAGFAQARACIAEPSKAHAALTHNVLTMAIDKAMGEAKALIAKSEFNQAGKMLQQIQQVAEENNVTLPPEHAVMLKQAMQGTVDQYFAKLDEALKSGKMTQEQFNDNEAGACGQVANWPVKAPARCEKYKTKS